MKRWFPFLLIAWSTVVGIQKTDAQYVTISDPNLLSWLQNNGYASCISGSQLDTTCSALLNATTVDISFSNLSNITEIRYFDNLESLDCSNNPFLGNFPVLPDGLTSLTCAYTGISSLPPLPASLTLLNCTYSPVFSLPPLPASLNKLHCSYCMNLTSLPSLPSGLLELECASIPITTLPELPDSLAVFLVYGNPNLLCIPPLSKFIGSENDFSIEWTGIVCLPNVIEHSGYIAAIDTMPLCEIINPQGCDLAWNITGTVRLDTNILCLNQNEPAVNAVKIQLLNGDTVVQQTYTNVDGKFSFQAQSDTYKVRIDTTVFPFYVFCPNDNEHISIVSGTQTDSTANFQVQCPTIFDGAAMSIALHSGLLITGHQFNSTFIAGPVANSILCSTTHSGTLQLIVPPQLEFLNSLVGSLPPTSQDGDTLTWIVPDFSTIDPNWDFRLRFRVDTSAQLGEQACIMLVLTTDGGDANSLNDTLINCFVIGSSYDPNFKEVYPNVVQQPGKYHTYTIHFQNTGTAPAFNIVIKDTLNQNLDWSSFQLLAYSHDNLTQVLQNGIVHFNFPNINLPDSNSNEPDSHGWIQYKIKTDSTITPGIIIHNTAAIYFDFNDPIITNDAFVTYCTPIETQQSFNVCEGDSIQVGSNVYHQAGTYTNLFTSASGCDSTVVTAINVYLIDTSLSVGNATIAANGNAASYQWYDCNTNQPIAGETNQLFTPQQNGSYAVELTFASNCTAMSSCVNYTAVGIDAFHQGVLRVFPNPTRGDAHFDFGAMRGELSISNVLGQVVQRINVNETEIVMTGLPQGLLTFEFVAKDGTQHRGKFVVQK